MPIFFIFALVGLWMACFPEASWNASHNLRSWQYRNKPEPSAAGLWLHRLGGIITVGISGAVLFLFYFHP